jgi:hypothetical protein
VRKTLYCYNEEPAKLIHDVALRALWPDSQFSRLFSVNSCLKINPFVW